ncbi:YacL family protein [Paludisphaera rhizosphaerae]|uniref:YacL family protein n=1 Tax=Paludisphaera rhizosphaerae TaxID=2711216 RepID=UPI0028F45882|nr:YacL family protein [Paludisphaera rhizosphaerae]
MINCYRDEEGCFRVDANDLHPLIAAYLEQDVQRSLSACQNLLDILEDVKAGHRAEWSGTGNAHTVTIRPEAVVIHNEWDDGLGDAHLPCDVFRDCIEAWKACISS